MLWFLRILFALVVGTMVVVTTWAGSQCPLFAIPSEVLGHPWFVATLFDAYWGFITFYVWVAWKERRLAARVLWFVAIVLLGNLAMAMYMLGELFAVGSAAELDRVFARRNEGALRLPVFLTVVSAAVYLYSWRA